MFHISTLTLLGFNIKGETPKKKRQRHKKLQKVRKTELEHNDDKWLHNIFAFWPALGLQIVSSDYSLYLPKQVCCRRCRFFVFHRGSRDFTFPYVLKDNPILSCFVFGSNALLCISCQSINICINVSPLFLDLSTHQTWTMVTNRDPTCLFPLQNSKKYIMWINYR